LKIRIVKDVQGCVFKKGQAIRVADRQANEWIRAGVAVEYDGVAEPEPVRVTRVRSPRTEPVRLATHMDPPRFICSCGYVAKDAKSLAEHRKECESRPVKLNLGCGTIAEEGYINIDIRDLPGVDIVHDVADLSDLKLKAVDYILADDVLEHFPQREAETVLAHWISLLLLGGVIEIRCPDILHAVEVAESDEWLIQLIYGGQDYPQNFHRSGYTLATMKKLLEKNHMEVISEEQTIEGNMVVKAKK